jgi:hypothetical protein
MITAEKFSGKVTPVHVECIVLISEADKKMKTVSKQARLSENLEI